MKIAITGGTGFIGSALKEALVVKGHIPVILTRNPYLVKRTTENTRYVYWDPNNDNTLLPVIEEAGAVVNLAGESIGKKRWTASQKKKILESRVETTRRLVSAMNASERKPAVMIQASAIGYYDHSKEAVHTEESAPGNDFLSSVCIAWESEARKAEKSGVRLSIIRNGVVLGKSDGALHRMSLPFRMFVGGPLGTGRQWIQWVHIEDAVEIMIFAIENERVSGVLNAASPVQNTNREFSKTLAKVLRRPSWLSVPAPALRLLLGEMADPLLLRGERVLPARTLELGYKFRYNELESALSDLL